MNSQPVWRSHERLAAGCFLTAVFTLGGCSREPAGPETHAVTGAVTMAGQPVEGALVQFTPVAGDLGTAGAQAKTDADGKFDINIVLDMGKGTKRGLPAGKYNVTVTKMEAGAGTASLDNPPRNILPAKFASVQTTNLTAEVIADSENHFEFEL